MLLTSFTDGVERHRDMAEVNGRIFLNNVSLGIHGDTVRRPAYRGAKVRTLLETAPEAMRPSAKAAELRLTNDLGAPLPPGRARSAPRMEVSALAPARAQVDGKAVYLSPPLRFHDPPWDAAGPDLFPPPGHLAISEPPRRRQHRRRAKRPDCRRAARVGAPPDRSGGG